MTISVVIATYNRAALLRECLEQLRGQAFEDGDDIIVVDNASIDDTAHVVRAASQRFRVPVRYVRETTPGKTAALMTGIAMSRGDILGLTDDDVLVAHDWIGTLRQLFEDPGLSLVGGRVDARWERPAPRWLRTREHEGYGRMVSPLALLHYGPAQELGARTAVGANLAVRRQVLESVGGFSPHLGRMRGTLLCGEDHEFCERVRDAGYRCEYRPELRVRHWVPADHVTLRYYIRWFAWSGITHSLLERGDGTRVAADSSRMYHFKRLLLAVVGAARFGVVGRVAAAAERLMDAAYCAGYLWQDFKMRRQEFRARRQQAPQLPASSQTPAISLPERSLGSFTDANDGSDLSKHHASSSPREFGDFLRSDRA